MKFTTLPAEFLTSSRSIRDALADAAARQGSSAADAEKVWRVLPTRIQGSRAIKTIFAPSEVEMYEFGVPFNQLPDGTQATGTEQTPQVDWLFLAVAAAHRFLTPSQLSTWLERLSVAAKHQDVLTEMLPLAWADPSVSAHFEVPGLGVGNTKIDWRLTVTGLPEVIIDVKYRLTDLISHLMEIVPGLNAGLQKIPAAAPNADALFRSLETKLVACDPNVRLQGAWITTGLKHEPKSIEDVFLKLDGAKVHFALFGNWEGIQVHISRPGVELYPLLRALRIGGHIPSG